MSLESVIWAASLREATIAKYLERGQKFTFPNSNAVCTYLGAGRYVDDASGRKFRTGVRAAVIRKAGRNES